MSDIKLASAGDDIKLWDWSGFSQLKQFNPHTNQNVSCVCWSHDNKLLASSSTGGDKISVTSIADGRGDFSIGESHTCLAFNSSSRYIMGGGSDGIIHVWDVRHRKLKKSYRDHKGPVTSIQLNYNDSDVAAGAETGEIILYNLVSGQGSIPLTTPRVQAIRQLQYSHFKKSLLGAVSEDGTVNMWDTNKRSLIHSFPDLHKAPATGLVFSQLNDMLMMSVGLDKRIICYDATRMDTVKTIMAESPLTSIDMMYDGTTFVVGSTRGTIFVYDLRQAASPVRKMTGHKSSVQCLRFTNKPSGDVGGVPGKASSSSRKTNSNNNATLSAKPTKPSRGTPRSDGEPNMNGVTPQGLDSRNNNRVDTINTNKETAEYESVFSPIRDRISVPRWNSRSTPKDRISYIRASSSPAAMSGANHPAPGAHTPAQKDTDFAANSSLTKYGDGIFSPLAGETGSFSSRTYSPGMSFQSTPPTTSQIPTIGYTAPTPVYSSDQYTGQADISPTSNSDDSMTPVPVVAQAQTSQSKMPRVMSSVDQSGFHHSHSDPVITPPNADSVTPISRLNQPTPEGAGATSLPHDHRAKSSTSPVTTPPGATASAASAESSRHRGRPRSGDLGQSQVGNFQYEMVRSMIDEALEEFRDQVRRDVLNLHMDVLKQFHIQQAEIRTLLQQYSVNEELMSEIERLREENDKLKKKF